MLVGCGVGVVVGVLWAYGVCACMCVYVLFVAAPVRMHTSIGYVDAPSLGLLASEYV